MAEMILPGTYIEVRAEGLITPGRVTVGNLGVVGTASKGPIGKPTILGSATDARERFGDYDPWIDGKSDELTLVRALKLAYAHGATTVYAVRVAASSAAAAKFTVNAGGNPSVTLTAKSKGTWGNEIQVQVGEAEKNSFIKDEKHGGGGGTITLRRTAIVESARNRIRISRDEAPLVQLAVVYAAPTESGQVQINTTTGDLTFFTGEDPVAADEVTASYTVAKADSVEVTLTYKGLEETYLVPDGEALADAVNDRSVLMTAEVADPSNTAKPDLGSVSRTEKGANGESGADYQEGLDALLNTPAHIIVAAGQDDSFGAQLSAHCKVASSDAIRRERIGMIGSASDPPIDEILGHDLADGRIIFVAPGIQTKDTAVPPPDNDVTLPGAYAAAAVAGLLAGFPAHRSPTNKTLSVNGLEREYTSAELTQLVQNRVLALEKRLGIRIVKGITTATNTAWHQITTRRIVDYAKFGVRSAANPYIGLLNNERVRGALRATINSFLAEMVDDEMLIKYALEVTATRDEEKKGIARVTMTLQPTFSIDFIKVTMFLE